MKTLGEVAYQKYIEIINIPEGEYNCILKKLIEFSKLDSQQKQLWEDVAIEVVDAYLEVLENKHE